MVSSSIVGIHFHDTNLSVILPSHNTLHQSAFFLQCTTFQKHNNINLDYGILIMQRLEIDENGAFPVANFIGIILGFASISTLLVIQSLTVLLPLLFAPMVCITLIYLLYAANRSTSRDDENITVNPVRVDIL